MTTRTDAGAITGLPRPADSRSVTRFPTAEMKATDSGLVAREGIREVLHGGAVHAGDAGPPAARAAQARQPADTGHQRPRTLCSRATRHTRRRKTMKPQYRYASGIVMLLATGLMMGQGDPKPDATQPCSQAHEGGFALPHRSCSPALISDVNLPIDGGVSERSGGSYQLRRSSEGVALGP